MHRVHVLVQKLVAMLDTVAPRNARQRADEPHVPKETEV